MEFRPHRTVKCFMATTNGFAIVVDLLHLGKKNNAPLNNSFVFIYFAPLLGLLVKLWPTFNSCSLYDTHFIVWLV